MKVKGQLKDAQLEATTDATSKLGEIVYDTSRNNPVTHDGTNSQNIIVGDNTPSVDNALPRFDGANQHIKTTGVIVDDSNNITGVNQLILGERLGLKSYTTIERDSLTSLVEGHLIWNTTDGEIQTYNGSSWASGLSGLSDHIGDTYNAHDGSAISITPSGNQGSTTAQAAIDELQGDIDSINADTSLSDHISDTSTHGVSGEIVGTIDTQNLLSKTFSDELRMAELGSTPSTPSSGFKKIYPKSDGKLYTLNSGGNEVEVGSGGGGGGGGGFNIEDDPYFAQGDTWSDFDEGSVSLPVDLDGGSPSGLTVTVDENENQIASGNYSGTMKVAKAAANHQGEGRSKTYTVPQIIKDRGCIYGKMYVSSESGFEAGDFVLGCYDVTNAIVLEVTGLVDQELPRIVAGKSSLVSFRIPVQADTDSIRFGFMVATTSASALDIHVSGVSLGLDQPVPATVEYYLPNETLTITGATTNPTKGTTSIDNVALKRRDNMLIMDASYQQNSAGSAGSGAYDIELPSGLTIDDSSDKFATTSGNRQVLGYGTVYSTTNGNDQIFIRYNAGKIRMVDQASGSGTSSTFHRFSDSTLIFCFHAEIPIAEWADTNQVISSDSSNVDLVFARYTSETGQTLSSAVSTVIDYETMEIDSHGAVTTGASWVFTAPKTAYYNVIPNNRFGSMTGSGIFAGEFYKNGVLYTAFGGTEDFTSQRFTIGRPAIIPLDKGDTLTYKLYQGTGATKSLETSSTLNNITINEIPSLTTYGVYGDTGMINVGELASKNTRPIQLGSTGRPIWIDASYGYVIEDQFATDGDFASTLGWLKGGSGGAFEDSMPASVAPNDNFQKGVYLQPGTTDGNTVNYRLNSGDIVFGKGKYVFSSIVYIEGVGNGFNDVQYHCGLMTNVSTSAITHGAYFEYDWNDTAANWRCITNNASTETATDSGVQAYGTPHELLIIVNEAGSEVKFYIDGALVGTHITNIPTNEVGVGYSAKTLSSGSANRYKMAINHFSLTHLYLQDNTPLYGKWPAI